MLFRLTWQSVQGDHPIFLTVVCSKLIIFLQILNIQNFKRLTNYAVETYSTSLSIRWAIYSNEILARDIKVFLAGRK